jgi:hypothetical protein
MTEHEDFDEVEKSYLHAMAQSANDPDKQYELSIGLREYRLLYKTGNLARSDESRRRHR